MSGWIAGSFGGRWPRIFMALAAATALAGAAVWADPDGVHRVLLQRPAGAAGTAVVPDTFLRSWDPVTVFFTRDLGTPGAPEDRPERWVTFEPEHPGAWTWLDGRTLQFKPAEPWPALTRFDWEIERADMTLRTLMSPPKSTSPRNGETGLDPVESIALTFAEPLPPESLAEMVTIELRPLPGIEGGAGSTWLGVEDFEIKSMERAPGASSATYVLALERPIPEGVRAIVRFRLAEGDSADEAFYSFDFSTAEPFRVSRLGCGDGLIPITPGGSTYAPDQALRCRDAAILVDFSNPPAEIGPVEGRNLVRLEPAVEGLRWETSGRRLTIYGDFDRDTPYRVSLAPAPVRDTDGRALDLSGESSLYVYFPRQSPYLRWSHSEGIVERRGPQTLPMEGRGQGRVDLRIHPIDPLDRSLWPFPDSPVSVSESQRPPGPGEEPGAHTDLNRGPSTGEIAGRIKALGSPPLSRIVDLPLRDEGGAATFGLDLEPHLEHLVGGGEPGAYLVGVRNLDGSTDRSWMRIQVTDLSLTAVEEPQAVQFAVTSLSSGLPVGGALVRVEGVYTLRGEAPVWRTLAEGRTDGRGLFRWDAPGPEQHVSRRVRRIVVEKAGDVLVLDPDERVEVYGDGYWRQSYGTWLQWPWERLESRGAQAEDLCHLFSERPVYRPDEPVHLKGYLRRKESGALSPLTGEADLVVRGPGDAKFRYPLALTSQGSFYHLFSEEKLATGTWSAWLERGNTRHCSVNFQLDAYRLPRFEVSLHGPEIAPLDEAFQVELTADYYAGGRAAGLPVRWRVSQYPHTWSPEPREGFYYSSDGRYARGRSFQSSPELTREGETDRQGAATILLDPSVEPTAQPRSYVIEATVTGADDQTVTQTRRVLALPPFVLGLSVPRYIEDADAIRPQILVADAEGELIAGQEVTVRLIQRQWHSHLRASDFSDGEARYVTDVVDEPVSEQTVTSADEPLTVELPIERSGVYLVEIESRDQQGRVQVVSIDLYAGGAEPVSWEKPQAGVFELTPDAEGYDPGETARLLIKSPYQTGEALVIVEAPEGNRYEWVRVRGGAGSFRVKVEKTWVPRVPIHVVLSRGRAADGARVTARSDDLGRPATVASTAWLDVNPTENRVEVELTHPEKALPGEEIPVTIRLTDPRGEPLSGEVALWLVDQAVLSLGTEQRLDPLPDFITDVRTYLSLRDTRNRIFGRVPFYEMPGGDGWEEEEEPLEKATVRKNFKPVPFYDPAIQVGANGEARVTVPLPDNLTRFKVRAKAISGSERFGFGVGEVAVRLPVIVQPALPRFARPGDSFDAVALGRVVEGAGGDGSAQIQVEGATLAGGDRLAVALDTAEPSRIAFPVEIDTPGYTADGALERDSLTFRVGISRASDGASDAFQVEIPLVDDRRRVVVRQMAELVSGAPVEIPGLPEAARPGTVQRSILLSNQPGLVKMAAGLDFLLAYPYGCTEQRLSKARAWLALARFESLMQSGGGDERAQQVVDDVLEWLPGALDRQGLVAYWPGSEGYVSLSAWVLEFLVEAREAGFAVDEGMFDGLVRSLEKSLRSDYGHFIDGEAWLERTMALSALTRAGQFKEAYFSELGRSATWKDAEGTAAVVLAGARAGQADSPVMEGLIEELSDAVVTRLYQGAEIYGGLQDQRGRSGRILPSEARSVATIARALAAAEPDHPRLPLLTDALVTLGGDDGWGSTNANAEALLALAEIMETSSSRAYSVELTGDGGTRSLSIGADNPLGQLIETDGAAARATLKGGADEPLALRVETAYVPDADGSQVDPSASGFVVSRELMKQLPSGPAERIALESGGETVTLAVGDVIEDHVQVVNPSDRHYAVVVVPLAAGMEPLNPNLATAPPEATPDGQLTRAPTYATYLDDHVAFYYNELPKGTYDFYFRTRATTEGRFIQPPARAEMMYDAAVQGNSSGARIVVAR